VVYQGTFQDTTGKDIYYFASSNAIDENENVAYTFTGSNNLTGTSAVDPQPFMARINDAGYAGTPQGVISVQSNLGLDEITQNNYWEEAVSIAIDPTDDLSFWGTGQWIPSSNQSSCCDWNTQVFVCQAGNTGGGTYCP
jgi:hypothetical protein